MLRDLMHDRLAYWSRDEMPIDEGDQQTLDDRTIDEARFRPVSSPLTPCRRPIAVVFPALSLGFYGFWRGIFHRFVFLYWASVWRRKASKMFGLISRIENTALSFGIAAAQSGRGGQGVTRVIRHIPNRQAIQSIVEAARRNKARAIAAEAENIQLRQQVFELLQVVQAASSR